METIAKYKASNFKWSFAVNNYVLWSVWHLSEINIVSSEVENIDFNLFDFASILLELS